MRKKNFYESLVNKINEESCDRNSFLKNVYISFICSIRNQQKCKQKR